MQGQMPVQHFFKTCQGLNEGTKIVNKINIIYRYLFILTAYIFVNESFLYATQFVRDVACLYCRFTSTVNI